MLEDRRAATQALDRFYVSPAAGFPGVARGRGPWSTGHGGPGGFECWGRTPADPPGRRLTSGRAHSPVGVTPNISVRRSMS